MVEEALGAVQGDIGYLKDDIQCMNKHMYLLLMLHDELVTKEIVSAAATKAERLKETRVFILEGSESLNTKSRSQNSR